MAAMIDRPLKGAGPSRTPGPGARLLALGFDGILIGAYLAILTGVALAGPKAARFLGLDLSWPRNPVLADLAAFLTLVLPVGLYFALSESSSRQATWGKRRAGLRVVDVSGGRLSFGRAALRASLKLLPWQIAHTSLFHVPGWPWNPAEPPAWVYVGFGLCYGLVGANIGSLLISRERVALHDRAAGSRVISAG